MCSRDATRLMSNVLRPASNVYEERNRRKNASNFGNPERFAKEKRREVSRL